MTHNSSCGCTDVIAGIGRTILLVRLYVIEGEIEMVDMPSCIVSSRETSRAENPNCFAADFTPASILAGGEGIVPFSIITTAGNYERTQVFLFEQSEFLIATCKKKKTDCPDVCTHNLLVLVWENCLGSSVRSGNRKLPKHGIPLPVQIHSF